MPSSMRRPRREPRSRSLLADGALVREDLWLDAKLAGPDSESSGEVVDLLDALGRHDQVCGRNRPIRTSALGSGTIKLARNGGHESHGTWGSHIPTSFGQRMARARRIS